MKAVAIKMGILQYEQSWLNSCASAIHFRCVPPKNISWIYQLLGT
jgi:hypothetical protein